MIHKLTKITKKFNKNILEVKKYIEKTIHSDFLLQSKINNYFLNTHGKYIRSLLLLLTSCNKKQKINLTKIKAASIIEIIHNATLIHDDVIDNATLRRKKQTLNKKIGNIPSILYGDYLVAKSLKAGAEINNKKIQISIFDASANVCNGEIMQHYYKWEPKISEKLYLKIITLKTASLFSASFKVGSILGNYKLKEQNLLEKAGLFIGIAYQIIDDVSDFSISEELSGKRKFCDLNEGKITLPIIYLLNNSNIKDKEKTLKILFKQNKNSNQQILNLLYKYNTINLSLIKANTYLNEAKKIISKIKSLKYQKELIEFINLLQENDY